MEVQSPGLEGRSHDVLGMLQVLLEIVDRLLCRHRVEEEEAVQLNECCDEVLAAIAVIATAVMARAVFEKAEAVQPDCPAKMANTTSRERMMLLRRRG